MKTKAIIIFLAFTCFVGCKDVEKEQLRARIQELEQRAAQTTRAQSRRERDLAVQGFVLGSIVSSAFVVVLFGKKKDATGRGATTLGQTATEPGTPIRPSRPRTPTVQKSDVSRNSTPQLEKAGPNVEPDLIVVDLTSVLARIDRPTVSGLLSFAIGLERASIDVRWVYDAAAYKAVVAGTDEYSKVIVQFLSRRHNDLRLVNGGILASAYSLKNVPVVSNDNKIAIALAEKRGCPVSVYPLQLVGQALRCDILGQRRFTTYDVPKAVELLGLSSARSNQKLVSKPHSAMPMNGSANGSHSKAPTAPR